MQMWTGTAQEVINSPTQHQYKEWISVETQRKIELKWKYKEQVNNIKTRAAKKDAQEQYTKIHFVVFIL